MKKILVIDDEPELLEAVKIRLEDNSYVVSTANDGDSGLEKAEQDVPDLIILDISMAQMDGYTMIRELKQNEKTKSIPVIILTAHAVMKDLFELEGIEEYIVKPYEDQDLLLRVSRALKK